MTGGDLLLTQTDSGNYDVSKNDAGDDLALDPGLGTAILLCLFCDARAKDDDEIPDGSNNRRGWWADAEFGSRLWLLERSKITPDLMRRAREYSLEALQVLVDAGVAEKFRVTVTRSGTYSMQIDVAAIWKGSAEQLFRYFYNWDRIEQGKIPNAA